MSQGAAMRYTVAKDATVGRPVWHRLRWDTGRRTLCGRVLVDPVVAAFDPVRKSYQWPAVDHVCRSCARIQERA